MSPVKGLFVESDVLGLFTTYIQLHFVKPTVQKIVRKPEPGTFIFF